MSRVEWTQATGAVVREMWIDAMPELRDRLLEAVNRVQQRLERDPLGESESRTDDRRIMFEAPLGIVFRLEETVVLVADMWMFRTSS